MEWLLLSDEQIHTLLAASLRLLEVDDPLQRNGKEAQQRLNEEGPDEGGRNYTPVSVELCIGSSQTQITGETLRRSGYLVKR